MRRHRGLANAEAAFTMPAQIEPPKHDARCEENLVELATLTTLAIPAAACPASSVMLAKAGIQGRRTAWCNNTSGSAQTAFEFPLGARIL